MRGQCSTLLGVVWQLMHAIKARQWRVPEPLSTDKRIHINIVPQATQAPDQAFNLVHYEVHQRLQVCDGGGGGGVVSTLCG